jgi:sterol desaturase/sphingolipid hydroxylase (fatty acid hydroxylase superfamily)
MTEWVATASLSALSAAVTAFFAGSTLAILALGFCLERLPTPRIWALPLEPGQLRHELLGNLVFIAVTSACFIVALGTGVTRFAAASFAANFATFGALMLGFQVYYYGFHRLLHTRRWLRFHRWHHVSRVTTPLSAQSLSAVETLGWAVGYVLLPVLVSRWLPISLPGWAAYMFVNMLGNITGHANVELMPHIPRVASFAWWANPSIFHALHHARWKGHFGFQSAGMDRLFGSEFADWPVLHAQISARRALTSMRAGAEHSS